MCHTGTVDTMVNKAKSLSFIMFNLQHEFILNMVDHRTMSIALTAVRFKTENLITESMGAGHGEIWLTLVRMGPIIDLIILLLRFPKYPIIFTKTDIKVK